MNKYLLDGISNLKRSSAIIDAEMTMENVHDSILYFAFGVERLCKGLLYDLNPALILASGKYVDLVRLSYLDKVVDQDFLKQNKDKGVQAATFSEILNRSVLFSISCKENKAVLTNLKEYRNVLAHQALSKFNEENTRIWLLGVYYPVVSSLATELSINLTDVFGAREAVLESYSLQAQHQQAIEKRVGIIIGAHKSNWQKINSPNHIAIAQRSTSLDLHQPRNSHDNSYEEYECPACGNAAVLEIEPEFDYADGHGYLAGAYPTELRCHYCSFKITDHEDMSFLNLDDWWKNSGQEKT